MPTVDEIMAVASLAITDRNLGQDAVSAKHEILSSYTQSQSGADVEDFGTK